MTDRYGEHRIHLRLYHPFLLLGRIRIKGKYFHLGYYCNYRHDSCNTDYQPHRWRKNKQEIDLDLRDHQFCKQLCKYSKQAAPGRK